MKERKPIFFDEQQRRWRRMRRGMEITGALLALLLLNFVASIFINPDLPELVLTETRPGVHAATPRRKPKPTVVRVGRRKRVAAIGKVPTSYDPLRAAFYVPWDATSLASLQQHYRDLDLVITSTMHMSSANGRVDVDKDPRMKAWLDTLGVEILMMPMVNNAQGKAWHTADMVAMLANPTARRRAIDMIMSYTANTKQAGVVLDFEDVPDASQPNFRQFVKELGAGMHSINLKLLVALPAADPVYEYKQVAALADAIILMNYDQHWLNSAPGAISSQDWYAGNMESVLKEVPPEKVIVAIGNYAYDWTEPRRGEQRIQAVTRSIQDAMVTAKESEAKIEFDDDLLNTHFSYYDEANRLHQVWMLDGVTGYNQLRAAERANVHGTALWRLGSEDASLWSIWDATQPDDEIRARLATMPPGNDLILEGEGDIWKILSKPQIGKREIHFDLESQLITVEKVTVFPLSYEIDQIGAAKKKVALSFDDGPDPKFTPQILDILKQEKVPGLFFLIGEAATEQPALMKRIFDDGHEIGNHTFYHPHFSTISSGQFSMELNLTERLLESKLGIKSLMFRPPYGIDHLPETADEIAMLPETQDRGYVLVGARIDPHDWARPAADKIVAQVVEEAKAGKGNIVLLHDGGGDRTQTVLALPHIIEGLRSAGFQFVSVSDLLGKTRAEVMPPLTPVEQMRAQADSVIFSVLHGFRLGMVWVFLVGIALVTGRVLIVGVLALVEKFLPQDAGPLGFHPRVSVLIPAHNEEAAIVETVQSALDSRLPAEWPPIEVIVVNDGSTDSTGEQLHENFGHDARVHIIEQVNMGKPAALNRARESAGGEVLITIDADTYVEPDAVAKLARHFGDATVGAVAGNVKVGNRDRWLTRWQALEYVTSQNLEKRAFDLLNCIAVVPGALGAWRAEAVGAAGGISADTVAEDTDLTIAIRRLGWRILYDDTAIAHTQAPETVRELLRQRLRWTFGTMQAVWKHRDTLGRWKYGTLGWIALPNVFLFQILLPLFSPVIDLMFLVTLLLWGLAKIPALSGHIQQLWTTDDVLRSLIFFAAFMLIDFLTCVLAFALEKKEDWTLLAPLLPQRFVYRQMMYWVLFRSIVQAAQGRAVGWSGPPSAAGRTVTAQRTAAEEPTPVGHG